MSFLNVARCAGTVCRALTRKALRLTLNLMEFKVVELEREPIEFDLALPPGRVDLGDEAKQEGDLAASGLAEVIHEHRGPRDIVADIQPGGGSLQVLIRSAVRTVRGGHVEIPIESEFDLIFRPVVADSEPTERSITAPETEIGYYQGQSFA